MARLQAGRGRPRAARSSCSTRPSGCTSATSRRTCGRSPATRGADAGRARATRRSPGWAARAGSVRRRRPVLPARVRARHPGQGAARRSTRRTRGADAPRRRGRAARPASGRGRGRAAGPAASSRSWCCRRSPSMPAATPRAAGAAGTCADAGRAGGLRPRVRGRGRHRWPRCSGPSAHRRPRADATFAGCCGRAPRAAVPRRPEQPAPSQRPGLVEPLSERELDVLRLLGTDLDGPAIARELVVSLNTVRTHTQNIYTKLGVNSRRAAVRRAGELDLLSRDPLTLTPRVGATPASDSPPRSPHVVMPAHHIRSYFRHHDGHASRQDRPDQPEEEHHERQPPPRRRTPVRDPHQGTPRRPLGRLVRRDDPHRRRPTAPPSSRAPSSTRPRCTACCSRLRDIGLPLLSVTQRRRRPTASPPPNPDNPTKETDMTTTAPHRTHRRAPTPRWTRRARPPAPAGVFYLITFAASIPAAVPAQPRAERPQLHRQRRRRHPGAPGLLPRRGHRPGRHRHRRRRSTRWSSGRTKSLALGFVTTRMIEAAVIMIGVVSLLAVVTLRQDSPAEPEPTRRRS